MTDAQAHRIAAKARRDAARAYRTGDPAADAKSKKADDAGEIANGVEADRVMDRALRADWRAALHEDESQAHEEAAEEAAEPQRGDYTVAAAALADLVEQAADRGDDRAAVDTQFEANQTSTNALGRASELQTPEAWADARGAGEEAARGQRAWKRAYDATFPDAAAPGR